MIDFLKSQLLLLVVGVGAVSGGTGWVAKGQLYGNELDACQVLLANMEEARRKSDEAQRRRDDRRRRDDEYLEGLRDKSSGSIMVPKGEGL